MRNLFLDQVNYEINHQFRFSINTTLNDPIKKNSETKRKKKSELTPFFLKKKRLLLFITFNFSHSSFNSLQITILIFFHEMENQLDIKMVLKTRDNNIKNKLK